MRRARENHGNTRTCPEYFSPRSKVMDHTLQECSLPNFASFLQETPMKPSQVPNQLPHPPPRRMLPLQSPELCHRDRLAPSRHPPQHRLGPIPPSRFAPSNPADVGQPVNGPLLMPRHRLSPLHHPAQPPWPVPISPTNSGATADRPQPSSPSVFHHGSPQFMKDFSDHSSSSHIRTDHMTESNVSLSHSGSKSVTAQRQESNQVQSNDVRSPTHTIQLHRPPTTPALNTRAPQDACPLPRSGSEHRSPGNSQWPPRAYQPSPSTQFSDRSSGSSLPVTHSPVTPRQDQLHKEACSSEKSIPVDLNHSSQSQKWRREIEDYDGSAKKLCLQGAHSGKAQTPKPTVGSSLGTSLASQPSSGPSLALEQSPKTTDNHLCKEAACGQSTCSELSSTFKPIQSSCASLSPKPCIKKRPPMGAKQAYINSLQSQLIELSSPTKACEESFKSSEENCRRDKSNLLFSSELPQRDTGSSSGSHHSHVQRSISLISAKTLSRGDQLERRKSDSSTLKPAPKANSGSASGRAAERPKTARPRRPVAVPDDLGDLFTPDPLTYVVNPSHKGSKPKVDVGTTKGPTTDRSCSSSTGSSSITAVAGSSCPKPQAPTATGSSQVCLPTVALERIKLENLKSFSPKDSDLKNSPVTSSSRQLKHERVKSEEKHTSLLPNNARARSLKTETARPEHTSSHCSRSPLLGRQASEGGRKPLNLEDPIDDELEFSESMNFASHLDLTQSSHSSEEEEEEELISLQEIMTRVKKPPDTPEKGAFSEPSTPGHDGCQPKTQPLPTTTKTSIYKNSLDQMLKEISSNKRAKEIETQLLTACKEDLLRIAEYEEAEENREEGISTEHQKFLQRYSLMSIAIREVPPGEVVFNLEKFGQLFNQDTLQLRQCMVNPQGTAQKTLLWSSPAQLRLHVNIGLFQEAYSRSPCPTQVARFLFKMMSVHGERMLSEKILQALCDIACTAAYQIVKNRSQQFKVWVPSLADVVLVLMNMGVAFVTLFPFENLQPPFTEGALLEDIYIKSESPSSNKEQSTFPEHNCNNILKYLSYCMGLCPRAYSDNELLLLLTVVGRVGLDSRLILQSGVELYPLQYKILNNIRDWDTMLPRICLALTDMTDDHHNMCLLVQLLPDNTRGKQLRRHLSLSMISKLLDGDCTYKPTEKEIQLSELRPYLPRMQPSALLRGMARSCNRNQKDKEDTATLDQQSYYLCYSLLTLANEASNFQFFPARQKAQLLCLCSELETYVKCDIRESEKCLYRSKVKDLVARISTKWQMLLQRTRPLNGKLYDYWQPVLVDTLTSSQEDQEEDSDCDGEGPVMEVDEDEEGGVETSGTEENEVLMIAEDEEKEEGADSLDDSKETTDDAKPEEMEADDETGDRKETGDDTKPQEAAGDGAMDDANETDEMTESVHGVLNQDMTEMEPQVNKEPEVMDEQIDSGNMERTEVQTETLVDTRETSQRDQVAA